MKADLWLIIPCAGKGRRFGTALPKQYAQLLGKTVLEQTLSCFQNRGDIKAIVIPHAADDAILSSLEGVCLGLESKASVPIYLIEGGAERSDSVFNALQFIQQQADYDSEAWVAVHDAARPCVKATDLDAVFELAMNNEPGAILATAAVDTIKLLAADNVHIAQTMDRDYIALAQTPQVFKAQSLIEALSSCKTRDIKVTDEASAMEVCGYQPKVYLGKKSNIKITTADDLSLAAFYLQTHK